MIENDVLLYVLSYWTQGVCGASDNIVCLLCELSRYGDSSYLFLYGEHPEMLMFLLGWP